MTLPLAMVSGFHTGNSRRCKRAGHSAREAAIGQVRSTRVAHWLT